MMPLVHSECVSDLPGRSLIVFAQSECKLMFIRARAVRLRIGGSGACARGSVTGRCGVVVGCFRFEVGFGTGLGFG